MQKILLGSPALFNQFVQTGRAALSTTGVARGSSYPQTIAKQKGSKPIAGRAGIAPRFPGRPEQSFSIRQMEPPPRHRLIPGQYTLISQLWLLISKDRNNGKHRNWYRPYQVDKFFNPADHNCRRPDHPTAGPLNKLSIARTPTAVPPERRIQRFSPSPLSTASK